MLRQSKCYKSVIIVLLNMMLKFSAKVHLNACSLLPSTAIMPQIYAKNRTENQIFFYFLFEN